MSERSGDPAIRRDKPKHSRKHLDRTIAVRTIDPEIIGMQAKQKEIKDEARLIVLTAMVLSKKGGEVGAIVLPIIVLPKKGARQGEEEVSTSKK